MKYDLCIIITEVMIPVQPLFEITSRKANTISLNSHFAQMQLLFESSTFCCFSQIYHFPNQYVNFRFVLLPNLDLF